MDGLAALLDGPRARGAFLLRCLMDPPWSVRLLAESPLSITAVVRGQAWLLPDGAEAVLLEPGDIAVLRGSAHATVCDDPATAVQAVIHPGQVCRTPDGRELAEEMHQGVRSWGNSAEGQTLMLTGDYAVEGEVGGRLLRALPQVAVVSGAELGTPLLELLAVELSRDDPGQQAVLDRLLDLLLIATLRVWFAREEAVAPGWYAAQGDPVVGPGLRLLQHHPEHPWTVASLAGASGVSRAAFARRFTDLVGRPPMTFLTEWRLSLAADLLLEPNTTVAAVARQVGYATPFALSAAFKRLHGVSPQEWRTSRGAVQRSKASRTSLSSRP